MTKINPNMHVNVVRANNTDKAQETPQANVPSFAGQVSDLNGADAILGASQVKHVTHIAPGSPILDKAAPIISKDGPAQLRVALQDGTVTDVWSGREVPYSKGDIVMYYGEKPFDCGVNADVAEKCRAEGKETASDWNRSVDPDLMRETYVDKETGKYLIETGQLEAGKPPVDAIKKAKGGCLIMPEGTKVHSLETIEHNLPPVTVAVGQVVALDHKGNPYVQDVTQMLKRNKPTNDESAVLFDKMQAFVDTRKEIQAKYGESDPELAEAKIAEAWHELV